MLDEPFLLGSSSGLAAWQLARPLPVLSPSDTAAVVMEAFALQGVEALPVAEGSTAVGYLTRDDLVAAAGGLSYWHNHPQEVNQMPCGAAVRPFRTLVNAGAGLEELARSLDRAVHSVSSNGPSQPTTRRLTSDTQPLPPDTQSPIPGASLSTGAFHKQPFVPVIEEGGKLLGCIFEADLLSSPLRTLRLPSIGGMATPQGVYLAADGISGGVGFWALVSSGALMGIRVIAAEYAANWLCGGLDWCNSHLHWLNSWYPAARDTLQGLLQLFLFLVLMRFSALAGYHAAEHQTVHTLEAREPLTADRVRAKPRVHPRCGTNLMILLTMACFLISFVMSLQGSAADIGQYVLPLGLMLLFLFRLSIGGWVQQVFTTRPATDEQIASGIRAARELMANFTSREAGQTSGLQRFLSSGLVQVGLGMAGTFAAFQGLQWSFAHLAPLWPVFAHLLIKG